LRGTIDVCDSVEEEQDADGAGGKQEWTDAACVAKAFFFSPPQTGAKVKNDGVCG
jgi:hypothetical protein